MSLFENDLKAESILAQYLDERYKKASKQFNRINSIELQHKGIDLIFYNEDIPFKVDEKAQLHYLNLSLPTFALEIDYLKDGHLKDGWLYDINKWTEYYSFIFSIRLHNQKEILERFQDIQSADIVFVNRLRLISELERIKITQSICKEKSSTLREKTSVNRIEFSSQLNIQISRHLAEQPVNLIVRRSFLESIGIKLEE